MRKVKNKISETDVLLNFLEDCKKSFRLNKKIAFEFPAGSWQGAKKRSIADIHGASIAGIEAKPDFNSAKKDFQNNVGEAKALSSIDVTKRLKKYLDTKLFDKSFTLYPDNKKIVIYKKERKNLFYINENFDFAFLDLDNTISSNNLDSFLS